MMCFRDMSYCSASDECARKDCSRNFNTEEQAACKRWQDSFKGENKPGASFYPYQGTAECQARGGFLEMEC